MGVVPQEQLIWFDVEVEREKEIAGRASYPLELKLLLVVK